MFVLDLLLHHLWGYVLRMAFWFLKPLTVAVVALMRHRGEELARRTPTASVIRGSRLRLRWYERLAVKAHRLRALGDVSEVRDGMLETWLT